MRLDMNKDDIRRQVRARKKLIDDNERRQAAERVFDTVRNMSAYILAEHILLYHSLPDELSTREFIGRYAGDKHFYLPRVNGLNLEILPYSASHMHLGAFQIEEPDGDDTIDISQIDLIIVPAVAYDRNGNRVGRGKGYYDRLLRQSKAATIGVCYDFQIYDSIDTEEHDVAVHFVVTDRRTFKRRNKH